jgi:2-oxo-4-hydroxy-4-carboxy-5-ureidoimidazoline decarboxylase
MDRYAGIFEHSPWVAERALQKPGDFLTNALAVIRDATDEEQKSLIRAHPELAAKIDLTDASAAEQQRAGLRSLTPAEFEQFSTLNAGYQDKFGFPFVICVREHTKQSILDAIAARLHNDENTEQKTALDEIGKIAKYRLEAV